jgi:hypothetical protein
MEYNLLTKTCTNPVSSFLLCECICAAPVQATVKSLARDPVLPILTPTEQPLA